MKKLLLFAFALKCRRRTKSSWMTLVFLFFYVGETVQRHTAVPAYCFCLCRLDWHFMYYSKECIGARSAWLCVRLTSITGLKKQVNFSENPTQDQRGLNPRRMHDWRCSQALYQWATSPSSYKEVCPTPLFITLLLTVSEFWIYKLNQSRLLFF